MAFWDKWLGTVKEQRTQLYFRDDGKFQFRKLLIEDTFLVEKVGDDIVRGWKHMFKLQFAFPGYKNMPPDMVSLGTNRDIILDPYGIVSDKEKPLRDKKINENPWITDVAETQRYKAQNKPGTRLFVEKITLILGACVAAIVIAIVIRALRGHL